ncbi:hypothetical protein AVEN_37350-1, partial [Araneus ventricosus]
FFNDALFRAYCPHSYTDSHVYGGNQLFVLEKEIPCQENSPDSSSRYEI